MTRKHVPLGGTGILILLSLVIVSCSAAQTPTAVNTVDANLVYTEAAQTVQAGLNATASARPQATVTNTPEPTATRPAERPTATQPPVAGAAQPTATPEGAAAPSPTATVNAQATNTPASAGAPPAKTSGDKCDWVDQSPKDGSQVQKDASWDMTIVVKNSGVTTWTTKYALRFWGGDRLGQRALIDYTIDGKGFGRGRCVDRQFDSGCIGIVTRCGSNLQPCRARPIGDRREAHLNPIISRNSDPAPIAFG